jgi:hypothetical protein
VTAEGGKFRVIYRYTDPDEISARRNFREAARRLPCRGNFPLQVFAREDAGNGSSLMNKFPRVSRRVYPLFIILPLSHARLFLRARVIAAIRIIEF